MLGRAEEEGGVGLKFKSGGWGVLLVVRVRGVVWVVVLLLLLLVELVVLVMLSRVVGVYRCGKGRRGGLWVV